MNGDNDLIEFEVCRFDVSLADFVHFQSSRSSDNENVDAVSDDEY